MDDTATEPTDLSAQHPDSEGGVASGFDMFGGPAPVPSATSPAYRVLARKYRPRRFEDLIGQEAMVRTLSNAFEAGRIPQAWMLTGVRGVGKTTTARILARGLNYELPPGVGAGREAGPTIHLDRMGVHCQQIIDGTHIDVMEIDAASNNGVDNIRQINDAVRYAPVSARYKVYIVDEVHMLSAGAFNAFLKTLEEPPPHAKFIFATTEIRKVPVTILSRCQRFDLRRVEPAVLIAHLARICAAEGVTADDEALATIARAAEGSVRDALSLLDQAIAHGAGHVEAASVRDMLGLADRARIVDLFENVMRGDMRGAFAELRAQYDSGADPAVVVTDLANFTHLVTRLKLVPEAADDPSLTDAERRRGREFADGLSMRVLSRAWQMLTKALPEVQAAPRPLDAAEMVLVRVAYAADLPTPDEALRLLRDGAPLPPSGPGGGRPDPRGGGGGPGEGRALPQGFTTQGGSAAVMRALPGGLAEVAVAREPAVAAAAAAPAIKLARFEDFVALAAEKRDIGFKLALEREVRLVRFEDGQIEFAVEEGASRNLAADISRRLQDWTGRRWIVAISSQPGAPTLAEVAREREAERRSDAENHPLVRAVLERFPGARIIDVRDTRPAAAEGGADDAGTQDENEAHDATGAGEPMDDRP